MRGGFRRAESTTQTFRPPHPLLSLCWKTGSLGDSSGFYIHLLGRLVGWLVGVLQCENNRDSRSLQPVRKKTYSTNSCASMTSMRIAEKPKYRNEKLVIETLGSLEKPLK